MPKLNESGAGEKYSDLNGVGDGYYRDGDGFGCTNNLGGVVGFGDGTGFGHRGRYSLKSEWEGVLCQS